MLKVACIEQIQDKSLQCYLHLTKLRYILTHFHSDLILWQQLLSTVLCFVDEKVGKEKSKIVANPSQSWQG